MRDLPWLLAATLLAATLCAGAILEHRWSATPCVSLDCALERSETAR